MLRRCFAAYLPGLPVARRSLPNEVNCSPESDGDNVNSINDTVESDQCARIVREAHDYIVDVHDMQHIKTLKQLDATSGTTPNVMTRPEGYHSLEWVKYDKKDAASGNSESRHSCWAVCVCSASWLSLFVD